MPASVASDTSLVEMEGIQETPELKEPIKTYGQIVESVADDIWNNLIKENFEKGNMYESRQTNGTWRGIIDSEFKQKVLARINEKYLTVREAILTNLSYGRNEINFRIGPLPTKI